MSEFVLSSGYLDKTNFLFGTLSLNDNAGSCKVNLIFEILEKSENTQNYTFDNQVLSRNNQPYLSALQSFFSKENLLNIYSTLLKHYEQSSVLEQKFEFYIEFDNKENQKIRKVYSKKHSLLNVLFLDQVSLEGMREYQLEGINWLLENDIAVLADDMGLGKTVQAIKAMDNQFRKGTISNCLIICPVSLIKNWENELTKWAPHLIFNRFSSKTSDTDLIKLIANSHILITNYENLRTGLEFLKEYHFDLMLLDEAHRIRKFSSQVSKAVFDFNKKRLWLLTGTPIENNISDFLTLIGHLTGSKLNKSEKQRSLLYLQQQLKPYVLRRLKSNVLKELPPVSEIDLPVDLEEVQRKEYDAIWESRNDILNKDGSYFSVLSKLREVCDGEENYQNNSKAKVVGELVKNIQDNKEKVIIFSYYLKPLQAVHDYLKFLNIEFIKFYDLDISEREVAVEKFKNDKAKVAFVASSRIASEGLTLTEANNVIFLNRWWNPSSNNQARDRVVRLGQKKNVLIYNIYCSNTVEERVSEILKTKNSLYRNVVDGMVDNLELMSEELLYE